MAPRIVGLQVEVVGCQTICTHCWAQGVPYNAMPLQDIAWVLEQAARFRAATGLPVDAFPMHEVAAHPQASTVMRLFQDFSDADDGRSAADNGRPLFDPLSTTGVPLALRDDWQDLLNTCRTLGTTAVFLALHGVGEVHDGAVNRTGAYRETLLAAERVRSVGLDAGCDVFLTRENVGQFEVMVDALQEAGVDQFIVEPARYYPTGRGRRHEAVRPELQDLLPLAEKVRALSPFARDVWTDLAAYTEAAYVRRALAGEWVEQPRHNGDVLDLVCRRNLDVFSGAAGLYRQRHGNLRDDGAERVFHQALEKGPRPYDALWFWLEPCPSVQELAEQFGNADGQLVHFTPASMRYRWLDLAQQAVLKR